MIDAELIQQCADPSLKLEIVQKFIEEAGGADHLTVTVRAGERIILVPKPTTEDEARDMMREMRGDLEGSADARKVAAEILSPRGQSGAALAVQPLLAAAAVDLLPNFAISMLGLRRPLLSALPVRAGTFAMGRTLRWAFGSQQRK